MFPLHLMLAALVVVSVYERKSVVTRGPARRRKPGLSAQQSSLIAYLAADRELGITRWEAPAPLTTPRRPA
jgi:hypothetical protein